MSDEHISPEVTHAGPGEPEITVIGGVHGDEPSGVQAVHTLREADLDLQRGVAFVIANPAAVAAGERYLDSDLNRVFPGDPDGDREERLAAELCEIVGSTTTLSIHDTHSTREPFALVHRSDLREYDVASRLPVEQIVDHSGVNEGTITACGTVVELEVGPQGSADAAVSAEHQARSFLQRMDALPGAPPETSPEYYYMTEQVDKPPGSVYELHVRNFERVAPGTVYATIDGDPLVADEPFYPVLMSRCGYADIFGYKAQRLGNTLAEAKETARQLEGTQAESSSELEAE
jgi:succinylglutamate desuccinylase